MDAPLWRPTAEQIASSAITLFAERAANEWGAPSTDGYAALHRWSIDEPEAFWSGIWEFCGVLAKRRGERVLVDGDRLPGARWFPDARLNFAENLLRRSDDAPALRVHDERGFRRELSFAELHSEVARLAQRFESWGVGVGDRVAGILPNGSEAIVAMLACASRGAIWSSCSPDFGVQGAVDRFGQIEPKLLFGVDGYRYGGRTFDTSRKLAEIRERLPSVEQLVVVEHLGTLNAAPKAAIPFAEAIDVGETPTLRFAQLAFEHPLFVLYSSGTTGPPKCIVHGAGGTLLQHLKEHQLHVGLRADSRFFYHTTCGWMMWNWLASGLASGACLVLYDGSPFEPGASALFDLAESERIEVMGVSAKYLDAVAKEAVEPAQCHDLASLQTLLSTGSPLAPEGFDFVYSRVKRDVRLASISGGTDIVSCFVGGCPTLPVWRGEIQCAGLGMAVAVFDDAGDAISVGKGELVCTRPFPSTPVGFWNDPDDTRFRAAYFEHFPGVWHHGDFAEWTPHGGMRIHGRSDATLNPGGVRIGTAEIYRQVEQLDTVLEALVVGQEWQGDVRVVLFVRLRPGLRLDPPLVAEIRQRIRHGASPRHVPSVVLQVADIPRTKSGKIVELAVRDVIHGRPVVNREALANPEVLDAFRDLPELAR
ncbi:MAG: acetoacetate--CoA ligase [Deltaproteobacteria bacterium]|nr:acetoacetate--CoA ligase [Deltaproteobacteria bacterium]